MRRIAPPKRCGTVPVQRVGPPSSVRPARMLLYSSRHYEQVVWRCGQTEFEDVICAVDDVDMVAPKLIDRSLAHGRTLEKIQRLARRKLGIDVGLAPRLERVRLTRDYELFCMYVQGLADLEALDAIPDWRKRCAKAVCLIEEIWAADLSGWGQQTLERLAEFDQITCGHYGTIKPLQKLVGRTCWWLPGAVDAFRFFPGPAPPPRSIDVYSMGRRSELSHRALLDHATKHGWLYLFDTLEPRRVREGDLVQHRVQLAELVKRTRYFVANKGRADAIERIHTQEELGLRSFEGAAGGAVLLGQFPKSDVARALFDWPDAHIEVPYDSTDMPAIIDALERTPERVARIRRDNVVNSLRRHDWAYRWRCVLTALDMAPSEPLMHRERQLHELATRVERAVPHELEGRTARRATR